MIYRLTQSLNYWRQNRMQLYHAGVETIQLPDIHYGRKNADFGQGFYLTGDVDFAHRWARARDGKLPIVNHYELDERGLKVHRFTRDEAWFDYIFANRKGREDTLDADVVIGPIANDIIYDTFGIITSGFLSEEEAMKLLLIGPEYYQIVIKTQKAVQQLTWLDAVTITAAELEGYQAQLAAEEAAYQKLFAQALDKD